MKYVSERREGEWGGPRRKGTKAGRRVCVKAGKEIVLIAAPSMTSPFLALIYVLWSIWTVLVKSLVQVHVEPCPLPNVAIPGRNFRD